MKNQELFEKTVGILVKAYQNDTLEHGNCYACACGNLVAAGMGYEYVGRDFKLWKNFEAFGYYDLIKGKPSFFRSQKQLSEAENQVKSTGYSSRELNRIEIAFEAAPKGNNKDERMFNGLLAVYDVLCEIHEVSKDEVKSGELVFVK